MKRWFVLILVVALFGTASAELDIVKLDAPQTGEQQLLYALSERQSAQVIANMHATRKDDLELTRAAGYISDALYDFIISAGDGLPAPTSVALLIPNDRFGEDCQFSEIGIDDPATWASYGMNLGLSVNDYANMERDQAIFLERMSVTEPVEAWPGKGVAYVLRFYGEYGADVPQFVTAVSFSEDAPAAVAKTVMVYYRQIADRPEEFFAKALSMFGMDAFEIIRIKPDQ